MKRPKNLLLIAYFQEILPLRLASLAQGQDDSLFGNSLSRWDAQFGELMKKLILLATIAALFISPPLHAKSYKMVFLYPGGEGSTKDAAPILSTFFEYLGGRLKASFKGKYFNSITDGLVYIKGSKPDFGIVSWIALKENEGTLPTYGKLARTLPLPLGKTTDQFTIVGKSPNPNSKWIPPDSLILHSSVPISLSFLKANLAPEIKNGSTIHKTNTLLMTLKKIASGSNNNEVALLTPMEKYTLDNLKSDWINNLTTLYNCKPIPTALLVYFNDKPDITENLLKVLKEMPNDPEGEEILEELRLKGFQPM